MKTLAVGGEGGLGSELSTRLAEDSATHLNLETSTNAEPPVGMNISWLPLELKSNRSISNKKAVTRQPTAI